MKDILKNSLLTEYALIYSATLVEKIIHCEGNLSLETWACMTKQIWQIEGNSNM